MVGADAGVALIDEGESKTLHERLPNHCCEFGETHTSVGPLPSSSRGGAMHRTLPSVESDAFAVATAATPARVKRQAYASPPPRSAPLHTNSVPPPTGPEPGVTLRVSSSHSAV